MIESEIAEKIHEVTKVHSRLYLNLMKILDPNLKLNFFQKIRSGMFELSNKSDDDYDYLINELRKVFVERVEIRDKFFCEEFCKTQIFVNYLSELNN